MAQTVETSLEGTSPRSTILGAPPSPPPTPNMNGENTGKTGGSSPDQKGPDNGNSNATTVDDALPAADASGNNNGAASGGNNNPNSDVSNQAPSATNTDGSSSGHGGAQEGTAMDPAAAAAAAQGQFYANAAFFPQANGTFAAAGAPHNHNNPFAAHGASPLSPPRPTVAGAPVGIPPASPLFPRLNNNGAAAPGAEGVNPNANVNSFGYGAGPSYSNVASGGPDETGSWTDRNSQPGASPQVNSQQPGIPMPYGITATSSRAASGGRAYSFESDSMLPPAAVDAGVEGTPNPAYSPYGGSTSSGAQATPTLFAGGGQQWGYGAGGVPPPDMYGGAPPSPLQPRPTAHMPMGYGPPHHHHQPHPHHHHPAMAGALGMRPMPNHLAAGGAGPYGAAGGAPQFFPTSSPGPPIQTTASNKGPDGANLFIFHIPNHFTNLDMYQLFEPYGNLLSVRIMVEKDTGRSRGFGFVSYDSPESAALAIKALNGFAIGNKRLKVQHKQIRPKDMHNQDRDNGGYGMDPGIMVGNAYGNPSGMMGHGAPLPPSGPGWYERKPGAPQQGQGMEGVPSGAGGDDQNTELTNATSTGGDTPLGLTGTPGPTGDHGGPTGGPVPSTVSPLASLGSLQNALPDVGGGGAAGTGTQE